MIPGMLVKERIQFQSKGMGRKLEPCFCVVWIFAAGAFQTPGNAVSARLLGPSVLTSLAAQERRYEAQPASDQEGLMITAAGGIKPTVLRDGTASHGGRSAAALVLLVCT